jgi:hypothetical protein
VNMEYLFTTTPCKKEWTLFNQTCYKVFDSIMNQSEAITFCQTQNSSLVKIHSDDEFNWLKNFLNTNTKKIVWVN